MTKLALVIGTWFGCGYFPWGPGTAGSIAAVLMVAALPYFGLGRYALVALVFLILLPGIWAATMTARHVGKKDPGIVVVDEVLGAVGHASGGAGMELEEPGGGADIVSVVRYLETVAGAESGEVAGRCGNCRR